MKSATAWAPGNISCIFQICKGRTSRTSGSRGLGFTIDKGATVSVREGKSTAIFYNNKKMHFPTVESVIKKLTKRKINAKISSPLPLGAGFGMSGASALAAAHAINKLLKLRKPRMDLALLAHAAEVEFGTGLGDVVNQHYGGLLVKLDPSWKFSVVMPKMAYGEVYCISLGKISTKKILSDESRKKRINRAAERSLKAIEEILKQKGGRLDFKEIIAISREFAQESGLLQEKKTRETIQRIEKNGGRASMIMLGNAIFSDTPFPGCMVLRIANEAAR